ncbi:MAG: hypothetical protein AB2L16_09040 [Anaerolineaceae bacterium]
MKKTIPILIAAAAALFILAALILGEPLAGWLEIVLNWAVIVASAALLVAIATLILTHLRNIVRGKRGFIFSIILISTFLVSFIGALVFGVDNSAYLRWVAAIQLPLETSLLGLAALVMTAAALQIFRNRGWSLLTISFGISALVFLVISLGLLQALNIPVLTTVINYLQRLPMIGARGLLIGIGIGALLMGSRVVLGLERPWGE